MNMTTAVLRGLFLLPVAALAILLTGAVWTETRPELHEQDTAVIHEADEPVEVIEYVRPVHTWTDEEEIMLAKLIYNEARGVQSTAQRAAVVWCVLNRLDNGSWGDTITDVVTYPAQFAYWEETPVELEFLNLAGDVLLRWETEKAGEATVGRVLPKEYLYFGSDHGINYFRPEYETFDNIWDWSLPDPYKS